MKQYAIAKAASQDLDEILEYFLTLNIVRVVSGYRNLKSMFSEPSIE